MACFKFKSLIASIALAIPVLAQGVSFAGITVSNGFGRCRTADDWGTVARDARAVGFKYIRIYDSDCNAPELASAAAAREGLQLMIGLLRIENLTQESIPTNTDLKAITAAYTKYGPQLYVGLTIGNEVPGAAIDIMNKVNYVKSYLASIDVHIPVSTVRMWANFQQDHVFCGGDFIGANAHVFFDGNRDSSQAGDFLTQIVIPRLQEACPGKKIHITETGWPSRGTSNNRAIASLQDERTAYTKLNCASAARLDVSMYLFEYDDQIWKAGSEIERSFGVFGKFPLLPLDSC